LPHTVYVDASSYSRGDTAEGVGVQTLLSSDKVRQRKEAQMQNTNNGGFVVRWLCELCSE